MRFPARFDGAVSALLVIALALGAGCGRGPLTPAAIARQAEPSVVTILGKNGIGSGFVIGEQGWIATNFHVIAGVGAPMSAVVGNGRRLPITQVVAFDVERDLAIVAVSDRSLPPVTFGDVARVRPGDAIVAIGTPGGLDHTVSDGIVSALRHMDRKGSSRSNRAVLQISAPISPGSSGGPLFNDQGEVIGITTFNLGGTNAQNLNFAVAVTELQALAATPRGMSVADFIAVHGKASSEQRARTASATAPTQAGNGISPTEAEARCDRNDYPACVVWADKLVNGKGTTKDPERGAAAVKKACNGGLVIACTTYGGMLAAGLGVPRDSKKGLALLHSACTDGENIACGVLGEFYLNGTVAPKDTAKGDRLLTSACEGGIVRTCGKLGSWLARSAAAEDRVRALYYLEKGCSGSDSTSCATLGLMHSDGRAGAHDVARALPYMRRACELGDRAACGAWERLRQTGSASRTRGNGSD